MMVKEHKFEKSVFKSVTIIYYSVTTVQEYIHSTGLRYYILVVDTTYGQHRHTWSKTLLI